MPAPILKVAPIITRVRDGQHELLMFDHPLEGHQFVKGTVEHKEDLRDAALRELQEESGISDATIIDKIGDVHYHLKGEQQHWHLFYMQPKAELSDRWEHFAQEEEGMWFRFFWQSIDMPIDTPWPEVYDNARRLIHQWLLR